MANGDAGEIRIDKRVLNIGGQMFSLAHISRVQVVKMTPRKTFTRMHPLVEIAILALLLAAVLVVTGKL
ncbi:DUF6232 family protein [Saccharothrix variisporea]|uniref:DUF6232 family protein n=1 Tax=Saccharothrix variisporea TaxID=543527 RepID=UPI0011C49D99|nr:DUF6232 family protein [Saccharothrix variisporea]